MVTIGFDKFTLSNGMDVILHESHAVPLTAVNVWYHVGSKDEVPGRTGFAHLFEHLMFEGSKNHPSSYFEPLQKVGGVLNGSTNNDRTNYWENIPSNYLELALWLESDRMGFLLDALNQQRLDIQRDVVKNERRQSYENRPYGMARALIQANLFPLPHPYNWLTIGEPDDLDAASLDDAKAFFRGFYSPSNSSLVIAGDFDPNVATGLVHHYFDDLPPGPTLTRLKRLESSLKGHISLTMYDRVQLPRLYLTWPSPARFDSYETALTLLADILAGGKSSRLYRSLVYEKQIAQSVNAYQMPGELSGEFGIEATVATGHTINEVEEAIFVELQGLRNNPPSVEELTRSLNTLSTNHVRQLERIGGFGGRADQLNSYNVMGGDPNLLNSRIDRYRAVNSEELQHALILLDARHVRLEVLPEPVHSVIASGLDRSRIPIASTKPSFNAPIPELSMLENGLKIMLVQKHELPTVAFGLLLNNGSTTDPSDRPGLTYLTNSLLDEGTSTRSSRQIAEEFELIGTHLNINIGREHTLLSAETLKQNWPRALELAADVLQRANFPGAEYERVQREHLTNLDRIKDEPTAIAERVSRMLLHGPTSAYGHPISGNSTSASTLTKANLIEHFQDYYSPATTTLLVVGDVSIEEVSTKAAAELGGWTTHKPPGQVNNNYSSSKNSRPTTLYLTDKPGAPQSVIRAGQLLIPRRHVDYNILNIVNYAFGGQFSARLNMNLRQTKGYSYGYNSSIDWQKMSSVLIAGGGVHASATKDSVFETLHEFKDISGHRPLSQEEFENAKIGTLQAFPSGFETSLRILDHLLELALFELPNNYMSEFPGNVQSISLEDVHRVATEHISDQHLQVLVVGDRLTLEKPLEELGLPLVFVDHDGMEIT